MAEATQYSSCYLLKLPAELRLRIYEHVLTHDGAFLWLNTYGRWSSWSQEISLNQDAKALLKTCRIINQEATPILYKKVHFRLHVDGKIGAPSTYLSRAGRFIQLVESVELRIYEVLEGMDENAKEVEYICTALAENPKVKIKDVVFFSSRFQIKSSLREL